MEGRFQSGPEAPLAIIGQPNVPERKLDNPIEVPAMLSWIAYGNFSADVRGLVDFPEGDWPTSVELLYYAFHIMVGLGTIFIVIMLLAAFMLWRKKLFSARWLLWPLVLAFPFPFIANIMGWLTAELGRQPWLVYGLMLTSEGGSPTVHAGTTLFTFLGFVGLYFVLGVFYLSLVMREIRHGPPSLPASALPKEN